MRKISGFGGWAFRWIVHVNVCEAAVGLVGDIILKTKMDVPNMRWAGGVLEVVLNGYYKNDTI